MKKILKTKLILGLILVIGFGASSATYAASITINFTGTTDRSIFGTSQQTGFWALESTTDVTGSITYDSTLVDVSAGTTLDKFQSNVGPSLLWNITFTVGGTTRSLNADASNVFTFILFDRTTLAGDLYSFGTTTFGLSLSDPLTGGADAISGLGGGNPPTTAPQLALFDGLTQGIYTREGLGNFLKFEITSMTVAPPTSVPEPGTLSLLASGLLVGCLAGFRKRFL